MRDVLEELARVTARGTPAAMATVARVRRSAPRLVGSAMARTGDGRVLGSVTGGCVESDVIARADEVLAGGPPRLLAYGIEDEDAFAAGLPCGGDVEVLLEAADPALIAELADEVAQDRAVAYVTGLDGEALGVRSLVRPGDPADPAVAALLASGESGVVSSERGDSLVVTLAPRPAMYVLGAIDFASALAHVGRFLGYRVTVCDPRTAFLTSERFPDADELIADWPHRALERLPVDARSAICVLTHDERFDVPALRAALATDAGYIGAMGSRRTTERRRERLVAEGVDERELERVHAPIGLPIRSRTPEEVAISICAEIVKTTREAAEARVAART